MLAELRATNSAFNIEILGINQIGDERYNPLITLGRVLPWLQDTAQSDIRASWKAVWRDVFVLDPLNQVSAVYNLTQHDLSKPENRAELKQLFLKAAQASDSDLDGLPDAWELHYFQDLNAVAGADPDQDAADNQTELAFGTNPKDPASRPGMTIVRNPASPQLPVTVSFRQFSGSLWRYSIETSADLATWTLTTPEGLAVQGPLHRYDGSGSSEVFCHPTAAALGLPTGYFRVRAVPRGTP